MNQNPPQHIFDHSGEILITTNSNKTIDNYPAPGEHQQSRLPARISPLESWKRHRDVASIPVEGVGIWVLEAGEPQAWRQEGSNAFPFCLGASRAGKTFICSLAIDTLREETASQNFDIACLYCDYRSKNPGILETLQASSRSGCGLSPLLRLPDGGQREDTRVNCDNPETVLAFRDGLPLLAFTAISRHRKNKALCFPWPACTAIIRRRAERRKPGDFPGISRWGCRCQALLRLPRAERANTHDLGPGGPLGTGARKLPLRALAGREKRGRAWQSGDSPGCRCLPLLRLRRAERRNTNVYNRKVPNR
ncbi:hypothetical protein L873DRAFT_1815613 [Choiromyces venosus 120613-1]|uniref:Nephrocystin 3-like N-terminal domain-containing protein n=1 Tax=Choiromyces venosus 120613-1 TaxID=1336337 RepID=A0A3N4J639_9PEZI|nr:hypothetical protein L873DRAFT_1815613 [Choiromyces venosus 120613-1]